MSTPPIPYAPREAQLFAEFRRRPGLLVRELAWRWSCVALLLAIAGYDGWRIWNHSLPGLRATGVFALSPDGALENPVHLLDVFSAIVRLFGPQIERACYGLAPLAIFCWICAFAWGRSVVLARFDPTLPRRPWLLAEGEAFRICGLLAFAVAWGAIIQALYHRLVEGASPHLFLFLIFALAITGVELAYSGHFRRAAILASALALVERRSLWSVFRRAWGLHRADEVQPLRNAVNRIRFLLTLAGVGLLFVPAPFGLGWPLVAWWVVWSLPPLAMADAWRLGAYLELLRVLRGREGGRP